MRTLKGLNVLVLSQDLFSSIEPISAAFFGWALLGNQFNWVGILGMAMIIATVIIIALEKRGQSS